MDEVRIIDLVAVGREDLRPAAAVAVDRLGDGAQRIAWLYNIGTATRSNSGDLVAQASASF
jgi:hypothetical protein